MYGNGGTQSVALGGYPAPVPTQPRSEAVSDEMKSLAVVVEDIHGAISQLEDRIQSILQSEPPSPQTAGPANGAPVRGVVLADALANANWRLLGANERIRRLVGRIGL